MYMHVQWNPSKTDTIGIKTFVRYSAVSFAQGLVADHAPSPFPIIANCDRTRLRAMKSTKLRRALLIYDIWTRIRGIYVSELSSTVGHLHLPTF